MIIIRSPVENILAFYFFRIVPVNPHLRASSERRSSIFSLEGGLEGLPLRVTFSPSYPLARRDVPLARARAF
jgi:hypothetical protein